MPRAATDATTDATETFVPDILDRKALDAIREMESPEMPDVLEQIVEVYLEHAQNQMTTLTEAVETSDIKTQHRIAHTLKSSSANLGARDLVALCQTLETDTATGPSDRAGELAAQIVETFGQVRAALLVEVAKG